VLKDIFLSSSVLIIPVRAKHLQSRVSVTEASSRFGRFKPEKEELARLPEVSGNELERLRARREMLKGMTPEQALQVIEFHDRLNVFEALDLAKKENKLMVPNDVIDRILNETIARLDVWTGTVVIYQEAGKAFEKWIEYENILFNVPIGFRDKKDCAIVVEHPDFDVVGSADTYELKIPNEHCLHLLENFPVKDHEWYDMDERFRIPEGMPPKISDLRILFRNEGCYIGPVSRGNFDDLGYNFRTGVVLYTGQLFRFGVALF
jgi:hypothetical protein